MSDLALYTSVTVHSLALSSCNVADTSGVASPEYPLIHVQVRYEYGRHSQAYRIECAIRR